MTGMVTLEGSPPPPENIRMNSDPVCVTEATDTQTEYYAVGSAGELGNVFVYVKEGLEGRTFPPATGMVTLDQKGCRYVPHVFGIRVGRRLKSSTATRPFTTSMRRRPPTTSSTPAADSGDAARADVRRTRDHGAVQL